MRVLFMTVALLVGAAISLDRVSAQDSQSFETLVSSGYEVKSVVALPPDMAARLTQGVNYDTAMITLQKGASVAVCYFALTNWVALNKDSLTSSSTCAVR